MKQFGQPAKGCCCTELSWGEGVGWGEDGGTIDDGDATVAFAAESVVIEGLQNGIVNREL